MEVTAPKPSAGAGAAAGGPLPRGLDSCVHCGMCLEACPTYRALGNEADSPRGRLHLMRQVEEGAAIAPGIRRHLSLCLDCRACESACPSFVPYGQVIEGMRERIVREAPAGLLARIVRPLVFEGLFPHPGRLKLLGRLLAWYESSGLRDGVRRVGLLDLLPEPLRRMEALAPSVEAGEVPPLVPAGGPPKGRVAMFTGCVMEAVFPRVNRMTERLLECAGYEVVRPEGQRCCGALHFHAGVAPTGRDLARANVRAFERPGLDFVCINAAGCGSTLKEYGHLLAGDPAWAARAAAFQARVKDATELLDEALPAGPFGELPAVATYQDACHLAHGQGVRKPPRNLLKRIRGLALREIDESDWCCGSAGIYNLVEPEMSMRVLDAKMEAIARAAPGLVVTANPGCVLQYRLGAKRHRMPFEARHIVEVLYEARRRGLPTPVESGRGGGRARSDLS